MFVRRTGSSLGGRVVAIWINNYDYDYDIF